MARLRYNGVQTTLAATLAASATTITFDAALTHVGGAVPTLAGSDFFLLSLMGATGVEEIVQVTAYTSGETTATVVRAQEATVDQEHLAGTEAIMAITAGDLEVLDGRVTVLEDAPPGGNTLFRGDWTTTPEVLAVTHLADSFPERWSGAGSLIDTGTAIGTPKPSQSQVWQLTAVEPSTQTATYDTTGIPELTGKTVTRAVVHYARQSNHGSKVHIYIGPDGLWAQGVNNALNSQGWSDLEMAMATANYQFRVATEANAVGTMQGWIAVGSFSFYVVDDSFEPYATGEFVAHQGRLWRSTVDANGSEPGLDANWVDAGLAADADLTLLEGRVTTLEAAPASPTDLNGLSDVDTATVAPILGDTLTFDGTNWVPDAAPAAGGGGGAVVVFKRNAGDVTVTANTRTPLATAAAAAVDAFDILVTVAAGDVLLVGLDAEIGNQSGTLRLDVQTVVAGAAVNAVSGSGDTYGVPGWIRLGGSTGFLSGVVPYVVQAGDIEGGQVRLRPTGKVDASSRVVAASANSPLTFWARNTGQ